MTALSYAGVHSRLRIDRGPAMDQTCECGRTASAWAYQGGAPDELASPYGPYSQDQSYYKPMCQLCHGRLDKAGKHREVCINGHQRTDHNRIISSQGHHLCRDCRAAWQKMALARRVLVALSPMSTSTKTKHYIGNREIAKIIGTDPATVRSYRRYNMLPEPEVMIEDRPGWTVETIKRWQASRPSLNKRPYSKNPPPGAADGD